MPPSRRLSALAQRRIDTLRAAAQARRVVLDPAWVVYDAMDAAQYPSYSYNDPDPEPVENWEAGTPSSFLGYTLPNPCTVYDAFLQRIGPHARELCKSLLPCKRCPALITSFLQWKKDAGETDYCLGGTAEAKYKKVRAFHTCHPGGPTYLSYVV